jgi:hypothetical protein
MHFQDARLHGDVFKDFDVGYESGSPIRNVLEKLKCLPNKHLKYLLVDVRA